MEFGLTVLRNVQDVEALIIHLILSKYLKEDFHSTAYAINVYVVPGPYALRLTRLPRVKIEAGEGSRLSYTFPLPVKAKRKSAGTGVSASKRKAKASNGDDESGEEISGLDDAADSEDEWDDPPPTAVVSKPKKQAKPRKSDTARTASLPSSKATGATSSLPRARSSTTGGKKAGKSSEPIFSDDEEDDEPVRPNNISALAAAAAQKRSTAAAVASGSRSSAKVRVPDSDIEENEYDADIVDDSEEEDLDPDGWAFTIGTKRTASSILGTHGSGASNGNGNMNGATGSSDTQRSYKKPRTSASGLAWTRPSGGAPAGVEVMELSSD